MVSGVTPKKGLYVVQSNHMEILSHALAEWVADPSDNEHFDPLETDIIIVQSRGMQRWLSMVIAQQNGICANIDFPFPNAFLDFLYHRIIGGPSIQGLFDPLPLAFGVMNLLPDLLNRAEFSDLRTYLVRDPHPLKEFQLARKIADLLDQYVVFRPDMVMAWERDDENPLPAQHQWQSILWRELTDRVPSPHRAAMQQQLIARLNQKSIDPHPLPRRLAVFGISHLPVFHLQVVNALSQHIPIHLFLMNPCRQFWDEIVSERQMVRLRLREHKSEMISDQSLHFEHGNRLLASWGEQGRQFYSLVHCLDNQSDDIYRDNETETLLGRLQQDILDLEERLEPVETQVDKSVQIHICHSAMREVEVLYDQLLNLMERYEDITPKDILVMTPQISTYAPYIHAVFGDCADNGVRIPYGIADQTMFRENPAVEAFMQILDLREARFEASRVVSLLEYECLRRRFHIDSLDIGTIETWVRQVNIRWGWDGHNRKKEGLPTFSTNTWRAGLDRLLLGYAMTSAEGLMFNDTVPSEAIEGTESTLLGNFISFVQKLHTCLSLLMFQTSMDRWEQILLQIVDELFVNDESTISDLQTLCEIIRQMAEGARLVGYGKEVPFEVIQYHLKDTFGRSSKVSGFMTGGVTFCAILPMRSVPSKIICLLGMQHDAFPQETREPGFNLMVNEPRLGDRSKRQDDKYLFLESLVSARRVFYLSYIGRSHFDNSEIPPSVLVDELTDYIKENFLIDPLRLTTLHPLQGFAPSYFFTTEKQLFSYSQENCRASRSLQTAAQSKPFFTHPLHPPIEHHIEPGELRAFFYHPSRFILESRLNVFLRDFSEQVDDRENFTLNPLDRFRLRQKLLASKLREPSTGPGYSYYKSIGDLPHGNIGRILFRQMDREVIAFANQIKKRISWPTPSTSPVDLAIGPLRIVGEIDSLYPDGRIVYRLADCRPQDFLSVFIDHLILNCMTNSEIPRKSMILCKNQVWHFAPISDPHPIMERLINIYWQGLSEPLPFFPRSSWVYAQKRYEGGGDRNTALRAARREWQGVDYSGAPSGESADPYNDRCFGHRDPLDLQFEEIAGSVYRPIIDCGRQEPLL